MFTIQKRCRSEYRNDPTTWQTIRHEANLEQTIRIVQDGLQKQDAVFQIWDNYSGERYTLQELYEIRELEEKGN